MATFKIENGVGFFRINGKPFVKGAYEMVINQDTVGVRPINQAGQSTYIANPVRFSEWSNFADVPYPTLAALVSDFESLFFLSEAALQYQFVAANYTDLITNVAPGAGYTPGSIAYVYNSQGTPWLPGTLLGTYYPQGGYVCTGAAWVSDRNNLATALEDLNDAVAQAELDIIALQSAVSANTASIVTINGQITAINNQITTIQNDIVTINGTLGVQAGQIATLQGNVVSLQSQINAINLLITPAAIQSAYDSQVPLVTQIEAEAGVVAVQRRWTPQRVLQAIRALSYFRTRPVEASLNIIAVNGIVNNQVVSFSNSVTLFNHTGPPPASRQLTGIVKPPGNENIIIDLFNASTVDLVLINNSVASAAGNRFLLPADITLPSLRSIRLIYFGVFQIWIPLNY